MFLRVVAVMFVAGCGAEVPLQDAGTDSGGPGPCALPSITQTVATLAGCSESGTSDGPRDAAHFHNPTNVLIAPSGVTYVTDFDSNRVRAIDPAGMTSTIYQATNFSAPFGLALAPGGKLYVETDDNDLGEHTTGTGTLWLIDPIAKTAEPLARNLGRPRGLAVLSDGRIAMADYMHHVVTIFDPVGKTETPLAGVLDSPGYANGTGTGAQFAQPYDLVVMPDGSIVVSDYDNHRIRRVLLDGTVTDVAGSGAIGALNGPAAVATFDAPQALAVLPNGDLFVSDVHRKVIRRISTGMVTTIAGDGTPGWLDSSDPRNARFYGLEGMDVDATRIVAADGNIGDDQNYHHVRVVQLTGI